MLTVQQVFLQKHEAGFHRGVVSGGSDLSQRSNQMVTIQSAHEGACSEMGTAVEVHNVPRHVPALLYSVFQGVYCQTGFHP